MEFPGHPDDRIRYSAWNIFSGRIIRNLCALEVAESAAKRGGFSRSRAWNLRGLDRRAPDDGASSQRLGLHGFLQRSSFSGIYHSALQDDSLGMPVIGFR